MYLIKCYENANGKSEIQKIYNEGTDDLQAELMAAIDHLKCRDREEWRRPRAAKLSKSNAFRDFFEIRLFANKVQQRPIGFFGPGKNDFTILLWATEKGGKLIPQDWCEIANRRRIQIENGVAKAELLQL